MPEGDHSQIYDDLMRFRPEGLTANAWAVMAGVSRTVWTDMRRHGNPSRRTLEKLLTAAGSSLAEFEALRIGRGAGNEPVGPAVAEPKAGWGADRLPPLPLIGTAIAGEWGEPASGICLIELRAAEFVERIPRPASLASDSGAYAITIVADRMWPRFRLGRRVAVSPAAAVVVGDDVLVKLGGARRSRGHCTALIGELVQRSGTAIELRQYNPDLTFKVAASDISAVEKVLGELV